MFLETLRRIVGTEGIVGAAEQERYLTEWRDRVQGVALAIVRPGSTAEISAIVRACAAARISIVPQGGNTGLSGGAIPRSADEIVVSLERMTAIRSINATDDSMVVEAGCTLADVQAAATGAGRSFPLSLSAEGSATIGGNIATNAGGINVLRFGTARDQVLGLEVVLANGDVWDGLRTLRKNTAGYDLKQVFIGSEGTLGIVTAAALRLRPAAVNSATAMTGLRDASQAIELLALLRSEIGEHVSAFELMSDRAMRFVLNYLSLERPPVEGNFPYYVLMTATSGRGLDLSAAFEAALTRAEAASLAGNTVIMVNKKQALELWRIRHAVSAAQKPEGSSLKHDISVPPGSIAPFIAAVNARVAAALPGVRPVVFGHVGDGNLHYNLSRPKVINDENFSRHSPKLAGIVYAAVREFHGSISAEHGIGQFKREALAENVERVELDAMRRLKKAFDPDNIMNPGKVL